MISWEASQRRRRCTRYASSLASCTKRSWGCMTSARRRRKTANSRALQGRKNHTSMLIGYARVSTNEQHLDLQRDALLKAGVAAKDIYTDTVTGVTSERPGLQAALSHLREGDTFVVWRLDRLGRSLQHLLETVTALKEQGVAF